MGPELVVISISPLLRGMGNSPVGRGPCPSGTLPLPSPPPLLAAQILTGTIFTCQCSQIFGGNQKLPSGGKGETQAEALIQRLIADGSCVDVRSCWQGAPPATQQSGTSARVSRRVPGVASQ